MENILVSVKVGKRIEADLKIPSHVTPRELISMLSEALEVNLPQESMIQAEPMGIVLEKNRSLEEQGVDTGALLSIV